MGWSEETYLSPRHGAPVLSDNLLVHHTSIRSLGDVGVSPGYTFAGGHLGPAPGERQRGTTAQPRQRRPEGTKRLDGRRCDLGSTGPQSPVIGGADRSHRWRIAAL